MYKKYIKSFLNFGEKYMRKIYSSFVSLLLVLVVAFSTLTGCNLVSVDTERDRNQVVATVSIGEGAPTDTIYKKDMLMAYLNYYYIYEQSYGYSRSQVFNLIINNLINNRVLIQYAIKTYAEQAGLTDFDWEAEDFISDDDKKDALYLTYKDINELIDSYTVKDEEEKLGDTLTSTDRVVPTGATNNTEVDKDAYIEKGIIVEGEEGRKAFAKVINLIKENDMLGDNYVANDITTTEYYDATLKGYYEEKLINKLQKDIQDATRAKVTYEKLQQEYEELYNKQKEYDNTAFVGLLDSLSASSPVVYSKYNGYGIAYNLLLGASEDLKAELAEWKENNPNASDAEYKAKREEIFSKITVKDLRSSWVNAGYDFDAETKKFTGDYTLTNPSYSLAFQGEVVELTPADAEDKEYRATATEMTLDEFIPFMEEYVYGTAKGGAIVDNRKVDTDVAEDEYINRVRELMFAFSTDDSDTALNIHKGYVVKPVPDGANQEEYQIVTRSPALIRGSSHKESYFREVPKVTCAMR